MQRPYAAAAAPSYYLTTLLTVIAVYPTPPPITGFPQAPARRQAQAEITSTPSLQPHSSTASGNGYRNPRAPSSTLWTSPAALTTPEGSVAPQLPPANSRPRSHVTVPLAAVVPVAVICFIYLMFGLLASRQLRESVRRILKAVTMRRDISTASASSLALPVAEEYALYRRRERHRAKELAGGVFAMPWACGHETAAAHAPIPGARGPQSTEMDKTTTPPLLATPRHSRHRSSSSPAASTISRGKSPSVAQTSARHTAWSSALAGSSAVAPSSADCRSPLFRRPHADTHPGSMACAAPTTIACETNNSLTLTQGQFRFASRAPGGSANISRSFLRVPPTAGAEKSPPL